MSFLQGRGHGEQHAGGSFGFSFAELLRPGEAFVAPDASVQNLVTGSATLRTAGHKRQLIQERGRTRHHDARGASTGHRGALWGRAGESCAGPWQACPTQVRGVGLLVVQTPSGRTHKNLVTPASSREGDKRLEDKEGKSHF